MRRHLPTILAALALPAGLAGYLATGTALRAVAPGLADTVVAIFLPLLVAGLVMVPFAAPWFDRRAKADLAAIQARRAAEAAAGSPGAAAGARARGADRAGGRDASGRDSAGRGSRQARRPRRP